MPVLYLEGHTVGIRQQNNPTPWELDIPGTKKKRNSNIFPLRFPFNAKKAKCRFGQISPKLECGVDEYLCFPYHVGTKHVKTNGFGSVYSMVLYTWKSEYALQWQSTKTICFC